MSHLSDMEELLQKIPNSSIADYMREALQCYSAGAYRGCIVLSCIALFDDSVNKLADIRSFNKKAREIHDEVLRRQKLQDVYETYLLEQLAANKLISELDVSTADTIKARRNKSAHPSGHKPSAEEARYIYFEVIDKFLCKKSFNSKVLADEILDRLENKSFFPTDDIDDVKSVIEHETKLLHKDAFPYFIAKLIDGVISTNSNLSQNSKYFLEGISGLNHDDWNLLLKDKLLEKKLDNDLFRSQCLAAISINPSLISTLSETAINRLKLAINSNTSETPNSSSVNSPAQMFENILNKQPKMLDLLESECVNFLNKHSYIYLSPLLAKYNDKLWNRYEEILLKKAGSATFNIANNFSGNFGIVEEEVVKKSSKVFLIKLVLSIIKAAEYGSWGAESIVSNKFENFKKLKDAVMNFIDEDPNDLIEIINSELTNIKSKESFVKKYLSIKKETA